jgi:predicted N-acetyltransferase YhbS
MTEKDLSCRLIQESDVDAVAAIYRVAFAPAYSEVELTRQRVGDERRGAVVAVDGSTAIGTIFFSFIEEDGRHVLFIDRVAVCAQHRRQGVASAMLAWLLHFASRFEHEFAFLLVNGGNTAAFKCYVRSGFVLNDSRLDKQWDYDPLLLRMERSAAGSLGC